MTGASPITTISLNAAYASIVVIGLAPIMYTYHRRYDMIFLLCYDNNDITQESINDAA